MHKPYEPYEPKPEGFWEKYALIPFFLAFASVGLTMGYGIAKQNEKDMQDVKEYQEQRVYHNLTKTR